MARNLEINDKLMQPVFDRVKTLIPVLGYEIPIFKPGKSTVQSIKKSQALIVISVFTDSRTAKTIGQQMWETTGRFEVLLSVPEKVPGMDIHKVATDFSDYLVDYYTVNACDDIDQFYIDGVYWEVDIDEINRSEYVTTLETRYFDYPLAQGG